VGQRGRRTLRDGQNGEYGSPFGVSGRNEGTAREPGEAQRTFQQIRLATEAAGEQMQAGMTVAWVTMQKALEKVSAELKG